MALKAQTPALPHPFLSPAPFSFFPLQHFFQVCQELSHVCRAPRRREEESPRCNELNRMGSDAARREKCAGLVAVRGRLHITAGLPQGILFNLYFAREAASASQDTSDFSAYQFPSSRWLNSLIFFASINLRHITANSIISETFLLSCFFIICAVLPLSFLNFVAFAAIENCH